MRALAQSSVVAIPLVWELHTMRQAGFSLCLGEAII